MGNKEKILITGLGVISPIGNNRKEFLASLKEGNSGRKEVKRFEVNKEGYYTKEAATITCCDFDLEEIDISKIPTIAYYSAKEAVEDAKLNIEEIEKYRVGVSVGTSHGGNHSLIKFIKQKIFQDYNQYDLLLSTSPGIAGLISKHLNIAGPNTTISTACSSSATAIGWAYDMIKYGHADYMIAGGADLFSELSFSGFTSLKLLCQNSCSPLSKNHSGLMLGEGAGFVILETESSARKRNVNSYGELLGYAIGNEAYHQTSSDPSGNNIYQNMERCLANSGLKAEDLDFINCHGTGTEVNDKAELSAIKKLLTNNKECYLTANKSQFGHALGAAASLEFCATLLAMKHGFVPSTINFEGPINGFEELNIVTEPGHEVDSSINIAISNSFAFAGHMGSIIVKSNLK